MEGGGGGSSKEYKFVLFVDLKKNSVLKVWLLLFGHAPLLNRSLSLKHKPSEIESPIPCRYSFQTEFIFAPCFFGQYDNKVNSVIW